jgi:hypothetical protein
MEPQDEDQAELEQAFADTADAAADAKIALGDQSVGRKVFTFVLLILAILGCGVGVGWAIYHSTHGP